MNLGAFYVVMLVSNKTGSEDIRDYKGLGSRAPSPCRRNGNFPYLADWLASDRRLYREAVFIWSVDSGQN